ncbi:MULTISPECIES: hypothetical protein [Streptomyces]|uniref:hypothetical protein n=1 Tax=Streptomyces TaxID=1883 RepID=UPI0022AF5055|nr:hypothetical protein [Streptomyces sp. H39-C1]MCZ4099889.1 hypothetical protein [Streptomyces sp. H39-C1]
MQVEEIPGGYRIRLTESQHWLLASSLSAFLESVQSSAEVDLMLGSTGGRLEGILAGAERAEVGSRVMLDVSLEEAHAIHALLTCTPSLFATEETFHVRVGAYRENLLAVAAGFTSAIRQLNQ